MGLTVATLFSGGGLKTLGAIQSGFTPVLAVEFDPAIASVYADNFGDKHLLVQDVCTVDYRPLEGVDSLMASPVCKNASVANAQGGESQIDIDTAVATARAIREMRPRFFFLENVYPYRNFEAFKIICDTLTGLGYGWDYWHLNSADYGVPQTRKRLILLARRDGKKPLKPRPTHAQNPAKEAGSLFGEPLLPWNGWYGAIEDLIPSLPETKLADWQLKRLENDKRFRSLMSDVLIDSLSEGQERGNGIKQRGEPVATKSLRQAPKCVMVEGDAAGDRPPTRSVGGEPMFALKTEGGGRVHRGLLIDGKPANYAGDIRVEGWEHPAPTLTSSQGKHPFRLVLERCRIVAMTPRCLARFMTLPDWYRLPESKKLASTVIGNGVPCALARVCIESLLS